ncbi:MAG: M56 family metallopeptidase [Roseburia sp.]|nr:M56 family metallopeptidase [Roseburia sp.]
MNWISILSQIFFAVLVTSASGSVMFFIWFLCRKLLQKRNPKLVYYLLRWVVIMFILPITYVAFITNYDSGYVKPMAGLTKMLFVVDAHNLMLQGIAIIWMIVTLFMCTFVVKNELARRRICKSNFDDGASLAQAEFERIKESLGIKGRVVLLHNDDPKLESPFVTGLFRRKVVIPYREYTKEELDVMLYHELTHIQKSDVFFRYLTMFAIILNSINPVSYLLWERVLLWSEADCDAKALDGLEKEGISKKQYYHIILNLMEAGPAEPTLFYYPMLLSVDESLYRRMEIMEKYRVNMKRVAKSVTFAWVMVLAMFSSVTAHAAGVGLAEAGDAALKETQEIMVDEETTVGNEVEDMLVETSDDVTIIYMNDGVMLLGEGTIDWDVPVETRCVSGSIYMAEGTKVSIACTATPNNCTYWYGLMYASSTCNVVEVTGVSSHTFTVPSNGYYRIMVENRSSQEISVVGGYSY